MLYPNLYQVLTIPAGRGNTKTKRHCLITNQNMVEERFRKQTLISALEYEVLKWQILKCRIKKGSHKMCCHQSDLDGRMEFWMRRRNILGRWGGCTMIKKWKAFKGLSNGKWFFFFFWWGGEHIIWRYVKTRSESKRNYVHSCQSHLHLFRVITVSH